MASEVRRVNFRVTVRAAGRSSRNASPVTDADLQQRLQRWLHHSDQSAARELMEHWHPIVAAIIRKHTSRPDDWDDLEQEVFGRIFKALPSFRPEQPIEHWVSRITLNACRQRWRTQSRRPELRWSDLSEAEQHAFDQARQQGDQSDHIASNDARSVMHRLLETLSADDRLVLSLLHLENKSVAEISALTGMNRVLVKVRAFRARKKLAAALQSLERGAGR